MKTQNVDGHICLSKHCTEQNYINKEDFIQDIGEGERGQNSV